MTTDLTGAALLSQRHGAPVWLIERSAAARAKASQSTVDAVLDGWVQEDASPQTPDASPEKVAGPQTPVASPEEADSPAEPAPSPSSPSGGGANEGGGGGQTLTGAALLTAVAEARGMPESLIERSAQARAGAAGVSLEDVLHEWAEEEGLEAASRTGADSGQQTADSPKATTSSPLPTPKPKAKPAVAVAAGLTGAALLTAVAEARGMPESLVERSAKARAKKTDGTVEDVLNEWAGEAGLGNASPQTPDASPEKDASPQTPDASPTTTPAAAGLTGATLLTAVAEARGMPESLVERSAKARAKKTDGTVEDVLNEWAAEAGLGVAGPQTPDASPEKDAGPQTPVASPTAAAGLTGAALLTAVAEARGMPESLVERSAAARAKKTDGTVEDVLNEWAAEAGLGVAGPQTPDASPTTTPAAAGLTGAALLTAVAEARGMPESLVERSAKARAKKTDGTVEDVLNEWAAEAGLGVAGPQSPVAGPEKDAGPQTPVAGPEEAASPTEPAPASSSPSGGGADEGGGGGQTPTDTAPQPTLRRARSWRHAVAIGAITALVPLVILTALVIFVDVPSDLSEAPWLLIGLEPFVGYLEPFIALVIIPGVALSWIVILAVVAWNPAVHPSTRRLALMVLVFIILAIGALTIVGALQT